MLCMCFPNDVDHLFISLLTICVSSLQKCLFKSFTHFFFDWVFIFFLVLSCIALCIFWIQILYQIGDLQTFSPNLYLFTFLMVSFAMNSLNFHVVQFT